MNLYVKQILKNYDNSIRKKIELIVIKIFKADKFLNYLIKNKSFSILQIWNDLIKENKLYGYESKNKFFHVTDLEIYNKLLKSY